VDDGFLNSAHISQCRPLQEEGLHAVAVQLDGLRAQVERPGVTLAVKAVTAGQNTQIQGLTQLYKTVMLLPLSGYI